jgi:hypothetical protein
MNLGNLNLFLTRFQKYSRIYIYTNYTKCQKNPKLKEIKNCHPMLNIQH